MRETYKWGVALRNFIAGIYASASLRLGLGGHNELPSSFCHHRYKKASTCRRPRPCAAKRQVL
jgi:hypothetical protein